MAEETPAPEGTNAAPTGAAQQPQAPSIRILAQYVKDLSFENPGLRASNAQPNIDLGIDVGATPHEDGNGMYEVSIRVQAKALVEEAVLFMCELDYAAIFQLQGFPQEEMEPALLIECPRLIFPFARRVIGDITRDGGFPPLLVDPIDFRSLYISQKQAAAQQAQPQGSGAGAGGPMAAALRPPESV